MQLQRRVGELEEQIKQKEDELSSVQSKADENVKVSNLERHEFFFITDFARLSNQNRPQSFPT